MAAKERGTLLWAEMGETEEGPGPKLLRAPRTWATGTGNYGFAQSFADTPRQAKRRWEVIVWRLILPGALAATLVVAASTVAAFWDGAYWRSPQPGQLGGKVQENGEGRIYSGFFRHPVLGNQEVNLRVRLLGPGTATWATFSPKEHVAVESTGNKVSFHTSELRMEGMLDTSGAINGEMWRSGIGGGYFLLRPFATRVQWSLRGTLPTSYTGFFTHSTLPDGEHVLVIDDFDCNGGATWTMMLTPEEAVVMERSGHQVKFTNGQTSLIGTMDAHGVMKGECIHQGVRGGDFKIAPYEEHLGWLPNVLSPAPHLVPFAGNCKGTATIAPSNHTARTTSSTVPPHVHEIHRGLLLGEGSLDALPPEGTATTTRTDDPTTLSDTTTTTDTTVTVVIKATAVDRLISPSLFCFELLMVRSEERWLALAQLQQGTGIFGCHAFSLFADGPLELGLGPFGPVLATPVQPQEKVWKAPVSGTDEGVWHNTPIFMEAWDIIQTDGIYRQYDWTVKVDPDTVFLPGNLQRILFQSTWMKPSIPLYLLNCKQWKSMQGPLEVLSQAAALIFFAGFQDCPDKVGDWRNWGEDWFASKCLDHLGVQSWEGFDYLDDMWCKVPYGLTGHTYQEEVKEHGPVCSDGKPAFHPYKIKAEFIACLDEAAREAP